MPRRARIKEEQAYYHIYNRGHNKDNIFETDEDKLAFIERLQRYIKKFNFVLLSYCVMTNHFHILIHSNGADISEMMKGLTLSYAYYYRKHHEWYGALMQSRFESKLLTEHNSIIRESMYIHCNPIKAGLVTSPADYKWSSMNYYLGDEDKFKIVNNSKVMSILGRKKEKCIHSYIELINQYIEEKGYNKCGLFSFYQDGDDYKYTYQNTEQFAVKRDHNSEKVVILVAMRNNLKPIDIYQRYCRENFEIKITCMFLLNLYCNMSYSEIGKIFDLSPSAIGRNIRLFIDNSKDNTYLQQELEYFAKNIA